MVSKLLKKTPTKSIKSRKSLRRSNRKSPIKNAASAAISSINKSIYTCHRRLIKIFEKLTRIATPIKKTPRKKGYQVLSKANPENDVVRRSLFNEKPTKLPPSKFPDRKTVFLDLDETLVHSTPQIPPERYDFVVRPVIDGQRVEFYVLKRPFVDEFLRFLSERFEVVVFTAGIEEYASLVVDRLDWGKAMISHRLYRDSCSDIDGKFVKDLGKVGRDLEKAVIVDDNPNSYELQRENAIPIMGFVDDGGDEELKKMMEWIGGLDLVEDVRDGVRAYVGDLEERRILQN